MASKIVADFIVQELNTQSVNAVNSKRENVSQFVINDENFPHHRNFPPLNSKKAHETGSLKVSANNFPQKHFFYVFHVLFSSSKNIFFLQIAANIFPRLKF